MPLHTAATSVAGFKGQQSRTPDTALCVPQRHNPTTGILFHLPAFLYPVIIGKHEEGSVALEFYIKQELSWLHR